MHTEEDLEYVYSMEATCTEVLDLCNRVTEEELETEDEESVEDDDQWCDETSERRLNNRKRSKTWPNEWTDDEYSRVWRNNGHLYYNFKSFALKQKNYIKIKLNR